MQAKQFAGSLLEEFPLSFIAILKIAGAILLKTNNHSIELVKNREWLPTLVVPNFL